MSLYQHPGRHTHLSLTSVPSLADVRHNSGLTWGEEKDNSCEQQGVTSPVPRPPGTPTDACALRHDLSPPSPVTRQRHMQT
ncbi:hypothetical protein O3P69_007161 [Scylla paramamosain]|uniref:Uncharacterized protein n=1 Tax=Scylla paramamosain TaxID=85552 RepID=A0AAW0V2U1_SCYPA